MKCAIRSKRILVVLLVSVCLYVSSYVALAYRFRSPAANMAYFVYSSKGYSEKCDLACYYGFYPLYRVHEHLFSSSFVRHNLDRPAVDPTLIGP